jgi:ribosome-binding protein aMBF1 (putative translation factor)
MNEKTLRTGLRKVADNGWFVVNITDKSVESLFDRKGKPPSEEAKKHFLSSLRVRIQDESIRRARQKLRTRVVPFEVFIGGIRECANLTRAEIGYRLGKDEESVRRIEEGDVNPIHLPPTDFADLAILFQIKIKDAMKLVDASRQTAERNSGKATTLSDGNSADPGNEESAKVLNLNLRKLKRKIAAGQLGVSDGSEGFWASLRDELARRGRRDLLN